MMRIFVRLTALIVALIVINGCTAFHGPVAGLPNRGDVVAGDTVTVKGNENIYTIARAHNVSMRELIVLNDLQPPFSVKPGQTLTLPADTAGGAAASMRGLAPIPEASPSGVIEQAPLQPIPGGAGSLPVTAAPVGDLNRPLAPRAALSTTVAPSPVRGAAPTTASSLPPLAASKPVEVAAAASPIAPTVALTEKPTPQPANASAFTAVWPVQGPILSNFGSKGQGLNNDGINIGAPKGASVVAAAGGMVVYAGNEMKGFGNLILIRHQGGWVTAYSHLDRMMVTKDTAVAQGDMIGTVGKTGDVASPQLHFEVRLAGKPVDPNAVTKAN